jgi:hypothetical protein
MKNTIQKLGTGLFTLGSTIQYLVYSVWSESVSLYESSEIVTGHEFGE